MDDLGAGDARDVIAAVEVAVESDPANHRLRRHLAELHLQAAQPERALWHAQRVLESVPDDLAALRVGQLASESCARPALAAAYQRLREALSASDETIVAPVPVPETVDDLVLGWEGTEAPAEADLGPVRPPSLRLADVGGMESVKARLESSFLAPLRSPELQAAFGKDLRGGLLLWGPPGCGKTFIARALAGELGASFFEVGLADVLDMWLGASERNLATIFERARRNTPCVLFFDEVEALAQKRTHLRNAAAMRGTVNQFLAELDGATRGNEGLFVLGATNHPWDVDPAMIRPGRFDRSVLVLPPDEHARAAILAHHLQRRPLDAGVDLERLASMTAGYSGADLALICDEATEQAMAASISADSIQRVTQRMLEKAVKETGRSVGPWLETARSFAMYANDSGTYDELVAYLQNWR